MTYIGCGVMFLYWKMYRGFVCSKVLMVRVLVLVIASDSPAHYVEMQKVWIRRSLTFKATSLEPGSQSTYAERIQMFGS